MSSDLQGLSPRLKYPHTMGIFLAVNAIRDAYLIMDGPSCSFNRGLMVHGRHDWASTLLSCTGYHRIQYGGVNVNTVASNYEDLIRERVRQVAEQPHASVILLSSLPMCNIAGMQYDRPLRDSSLGKPAFEVPGSSLSGEWLAGYADTLRILAQGMKLESGLARPDKVAVVGHLMERCEGDGVGNAAELRRMLAALGLDPVSVWLSDGDYASLRRVQEASTVVSLPSGRAAASILADRLTARLIETDLPFGLGETQRWLRSVAGALGREKEAEAFIEDELGRLVPKLEWALPYVFLNKRVVFLGEPSLYAGLRDLCGELGLELVSAFLSGPVPEGVRDAGALFEPTMAEIRSKWDEVKGDVDLVISNSDGLSVFKPECPWIEMGFPSLGYHALREEPFLGFRGALNLLHRLSEAITRADSLPGKRAGKESPSSSTSWESVDAALSGRSEAGAGS